MKEGIHPNYQECKVHCACGFEFDTRSTRPEIQVTICSHCHPFFTGKEKFVDTAGRIEKFQRRFNVAEGENPYARKPKKAKAKKADA